MRSESQTHLTLPRETLENQRIGLRLVCRPALTLVLALIVNHLVRENPWTLLGRWKCSLISECQPWHLALQHKVNNRRFPINGDYNIVHILHSLIVSSICSDPSGFESYHICLVFVRSGVEWNFMFPSLLSIVTMIESKGQGTWSSH